MPENADVLTVNMPDTVDAAMPRRVTGLAKVGYDRLFSRNPDGTYTHDFGGGFRFDGHLEGTDVEAAGDGVVAITPIRLPHASQVSAGERARFEGETV
jgi:broad specificity polyphosphatase/5'/3'-nucleotidase SurE